MTDPGAVEVAESRGDAPRDLLGHARGLIATPHAAMTGRWSRATALLARQVLEAEVAARCNQVDLAIAGCDARAQLLCLPLVVDDALAHDVSHAWAALSHACHHHPYDLAPTAEELAGLLATVERLLDAP